MIEGFRVIYEDINKAVRELTKSGVNVTGSHIRSRLNEGKKLLRLTA